MIRRNCLIRAASCGLTVTLIILAALLPTRTAPAQEATGPGLRMDASGVLLKDGKPVRAMGMNYMDAFTRCLKDPADTSYRAGFQTLAGHDIPFVRLNFGGFYPVEWSLYQTDPDRYFALMDAVVRAAEEAGVGLIPSLFWWTPCVPDLVGEPVSAWGKSGSKTQAFVRAYIRQVVARYVHSPALWAWELGNEYSLAVDLPNAADHRPPIVPSLGTPASRGPEDDLNSAIVNQAAAFFAAEVRAVDPDRPITTGHSLPRASAHHQRIQGTWEQDGVAAFRENLAFMTPDPMNLISIHVYPEARNKRFGADSVTYSEILGESARAAKDAGKALFLGEFGPPPDNEAPWTPETAREEGLALLKAIEDSPIQLSAFWVFDFAWQEAFINVTANNARSFYLTALQEANQRMRAVSE